MLRVGRGTVIDVTQPFSLVFVPRCVEVEDHYLVWNCMQSYVWGRPGVVMSVFGAWNAAFIVQHESYRVLKQAERVVADPPR